MPRKKPNYCIFTEASIVNRVRAIVPVASSHVSPSNPDGLEGYRVSDAKQHKSNKP